MADHLGVGRCLLESGEQVLVVRMLLRFQLEGRTGSRRAWTKKVI